MTRHSRVRRLTRAALQEKAATLSLAMAVVYGLASNGALHAGNYQMGLRGTDPGLIGLATALQAIGVIMALPLVSLLSRGVERSNLALSAGVLCWSGYLGVVLSSDIVIHMTARFFFGCGIGLGMAFTEYRAVSCVRRNLRPLFAMAFGMLLAAGHALGTLMTAISAEWVISIVAATLAAGSLMLAPWGKLPASERPISFADMSRIVFLSPATFLAAILFGFLDNGLLTMLPDFFTHAGLGRDELVLTSFAAFAGVCIFQIPAGMLAARNPPAVLLRVAILMLVISTMAAAMVPDVAWARLLSAFLMGGLVDIIYTVGLLSLACSIPRGQLAGANACFVSLCGLGEALGPSATGPALSGYGLAGGAGIVLLALATYWFVSAYSALTPPVASAMPGVPSR